MSLVVLVGVGNAHLFKKQRDSLDAPKERQRQRVRQTETDRQTDRQRDKQTDRRRGWGEGRVPKLPNRR